jgi:peptidoglycan/xylan/chitin deacetylase (PgdA/CDA1 family)
VALDKGVFTLSIDFELLWGTQDLFGTRRYARACRVEREVVVDRLLRLFAEHGVSATWCIVGHLMLGQCTPQNERSHPDMARPMHRWVQGDWYANDPGGDETTQPLLLARSLVERIRDCAVPQEIGAHSFSHVIFGDSGCSAAVADSEVAACVAAGRALGIEMTSFAFPRNRVGHLAALARHGFRVYRGPGPAWYDRSSERGAVARLAHLWDVLWARTPPTVVPEHTPEGLVNVPGSMVYFPADGVRRLVPLERRVSRAVKGLDAAARERQVFHLWLHPTNFATPLEPMLRGLGCVLNHANRLCASSALTVQNMRAFVSATA